jgi:F0F1-type ATP synthase assembly protein I
MTTEKDDKSTWAIGGGLLAGLGVGFFFLQTSPLAFVGSMILGLGIGLVITSLISRRK